VTQEQGDCHIHTQQGIDKAAPRKDRSGGRGKNPFLWKVRWVYWNPTPFVQVLIMAAAKLIPCCLGAVVMWDRIHQVWNSQMTNSPIIHMIATSPMMNFFCTFWLLFKNIPTCKPPLDCCRPLPNHHQRIAYRNQLWDTHWPTPRHLCWWIFPNELLHLILCVPSKAMIVLKWPCYLRASIQALGVPSRHVLPLIQFLILRKTKRLNHDKIWPVVTSSRIHTIEKLRN